MEKEISTIDISTIVNNPEIKPVQVVVFIAICLVIIICVILAVSWYKGKKVSDVKTDTATPLQSLWNVLNGKEKQSHWGERDRKSTCRQRKEEEQTQDLEKSSGAGAECTETERGRTEMTEIQEESEMLSKNGFQIGKVHEIGARQDQQDSFFVSDSTDVETCRRRGILGVVADGMGGLSNGGAVSSLVVRTCMEIFYQQSEYISAQDTLLRMAAAANAKVNQLLQGQERSGSTLVLAVVKDGYLYFLTIGDSRIYLYRNESLIVLNREHIFQEELALHAVNQEESMERVKNDPQIKSLTSYMGIGQLPHLDRNREGLKLKKGDKIILSSDGVFGTLTQEQMEEALTLKTTAAAEKLREMVEEAGVPHQDNYTAIIIEYEGKLDSTVKL